MPKNPTFINRISLKLKGGLRSRSTLWASERAPCCSAIAMQKPPVYMMGSSVMAGSARTFRLFESMVGARLSVVTLPTDP
jgi:hypothetical protein